MRMRRSKQLIFVMAAAALIMAGSMSLKGISAYFTTYVSAGGSQIVRMGAETEIEEDVSNMTKHISIVNTSQTNDCYVRVKVFNSSELEISYAEENDSGNKNLWTYSEEDGYWYYGPILAPGESTEILNAKIILPEGFDRDSFNVIVIQECTPVIYDKDGNPTADWNTVYKDYQEIEQ